MSLPPEIGPDFLQAIGAPVTPHMSAAVMAWAVQESGGQVIGNNPWNLHSWGGLPGQTGYRNAGPGDQNVAVFDTLAHGVAACAANLTRWQAYGYPAVVAAAKASDPIGFLNALAASSWSAGHYGGPAKNNLIPIYMQLIADMPVTGDSMLNLSGYPRQITLTKGTPLYEQAGATSPLTTLSGDSTVTVLGRVKSPGGWYLVHVDTDAGWADSVQRATGLYVSINGQPNFA